MISPLNNRGEHFNEEEDNEEASPSETLLRRK